MYKAYIFKSGKFLPSFNGSEFDSIEKIYQNIKWYYESKRGDQAAQFVIQCNEVIIGIVNKNSNEK